MSPAQETVVGYGYAPALTSLTRIHVNNRLLLNFPQPMNNNKGWPWKVDLPKFGKSIDEIKWPLVSIITPSYNQAEFLEQTIRSVLLQNYPNIEYIVIDGGSTDGSVLIIRRYEKYLSYWVTEEDNGQSEAINKGFALAKGEVLAWINSDDYYQPDAVRLAIHRLQSTNSSILYGNCNLLNKHGELLDVIKPRCFSSDLLLHYWIPNSIPPQPAIFFRRKLFLDYGPLDEILHYAMDYDFWLKILSHSEPIFLNKILANYRVHDRSKSVTSRSQFLSEWDFVSQRYIKTNASSKSSFWLAKYKFSRTMHKLILKIKSLILSFG